MSHSAWGLIPGVRHEIELIESGRRQKKNTEPSEAFSSSHNAVYGQRSFAANVVFRNRLLVGFSAESFWRNRTLLSTKSSHLAFRPIVTAERFKVVNGVLRQHCVDSHLDVGQLAPLVQRHECDCPTIFC
jgi:hypothetical protein